MNPRNILLKSKSWQEFEKLLKPLNKTDKGFCFALLVRYYLLIDPQYSTEIKNDHVWFATTNPIIPERIKKHIDYPVNIGDEGIDIFAETKEGKIWSIQAKYRSDESNSLGRKELSTFTELSFFHCQNIDLALIATPAESISYKFGKFKKYDEKISSIKHEVWSGLDQHFFQNLHRYINNQVVLIKPNKKMEHQKDAIKDAYEHFHTKKKSLGKIIMPCGTGKTLIAYWLADKLKAKNIVVAVPSLNLIRQCLRTWAIESTADKKKVNWIAVCSDQKVKDLNKDDFQVLVKDLGIRAHTKVNEITTWLKEKKLGKNIIFTTYDSGPNLAKASKKAKFKFDVGIFDEAHHTAGGKDSQSSTLLFNKNINISKRVFLTATERRYRGSSDDIISMDDPLIYGGEPCHYLSFKKALEYNNPPILTDYEIRAIFTPKKEILDLIRKNILIRPKTGPWNSVIEARALSSLSILNKTLKDIKFKHCISYHNTIDRADAFADSQGEFTKFLKLKTIKTFHVSSRITISARERLIKTFENITPSLVTNSRCLSEGVDIPKVDSILFCDPRESRIDVVQAMGRALRVEKNKKKSYIMIPAMVDEEGVIDDKDFQTIVNAVSAIGSSDDQLIDWFESVCKGGKSKGGKVKFVVPKGTKVDYQKITEALQIKIYDRLKFITKKDLSEEQIIEWIDAYLMEHKKLPTLKSGVIKGTNETWKIVSRSLNTGYRGLEKWKGLSLDKFLIEMGFKETKEDLSIEKIKEMGEQYFKKNNRYPNSRDRLIEGKDYTWGSVYGALKFGLRGLKRGNDLHEIFDCDKNGQPNISEDMILQKADEYYENNHNQYPNRVSQGEPLKNLSWKKIDNLLSKGSRGLPKIGGLKGLLNKHERKYSRRMKGNLYVEDIITLAKNYHKKTGKWPNRGLGDIVPGINMSWTAINSALVNGHRGLPSGKSLSEILIENGLKPEKADLTEEQIIKWAKAYFEKQGKWPTVKSGKINGTDENWTAINRALVGGYRGLLGGVSLSKLLISHSHKEKGK